MSDFETLHPWPVSAVGSSKGTGDPGIALLGCSPTMPLTIEIKGFFRDSSRGIACEDNESSILLARGL